MVGTGYWLLGSGYWKLGSGYLVLVVLGTARWIVFHISGEAGCHGKLDWSVYHRFLLSHSATVLDTGLLFNDS